MTITAGNSRASWLGRASAALLLLAAATRGDLAGDAARAFRRPEPLLRAETLDALRMRLGAADRLERNKVAAAVEKGLRKEGLAEVRLAAARLLFALHTGRALDRLVVTALDPREEVRAWLRERVAAQADAQLQEAIVRALRDDASWRLRASMADLLLAGAWDTARAPLLGALSDPHPAVVARAAEAL